MIIITGASRGIGKFLFDSYHTEEKVIGTYLNSEPSENAEKYIKLDVGDFEQIEKFMDENSGDLNDITLINCAGISYNSFAHKSDPAKWQKVIETNLFGTYNFIRALLPVMRQQKFGRIINFSSVVAVKPTPGVSAYSASKSALWGLSKSIAIENAALNVTINNVNLGYSELGMIKTVPEEFKNQILAQIPAGKLCEPVDILNTVQFLRSTSYLTGSSIDLSGGLV
ncbi:SDR family NAD(P)-dependent oxidoreductase [Salinimicrobium oceani]|uniref:SDR family NAD(P)-dependent oxidoreductase n=1 Tax=Salinimicrobium oceani TaxID=2722702 RepID=A0ABX1CYT8_9FLAO|nr:SDR family NAD(P)-dependent oxidoreductase [Salinimicrobium oceani]NJW53440.1 SDR family NAD(P)-dependent oxidoreductase [Salinimicrobium oceani]